MRRRMLLCAIALCALPLAAVAQSVKLKAHEIEALLTGNTATGLWSGVEYKSFFGADGVTFFAQKGARTTRGKWRVDAERDEYQSIWPGDEGWEGWYVMEYAGDFYWVSKSTPPTPFRITPGQDLIWPEE